MKYLFNKKLRPWLSDNPIPYQHTEPGLYDPKMFPWTDYVESHWKTIRDEFLQYIQGREESMVPYPDLTKTDKKNAWRTSGLIYWTQKSPPHIATFPKTWEIMKKIPNLSACSFNQLAPQSTIRPHIGDTNAMFRCHMGLVVPAAAPKCGLRVGNQITSWQEGKILVFNDAYEHTAWNNTDQYRYIISFDVMRPEFEQAKFWTAAQVLGKIYVEIAYLHKEWLARYFSAHWQKSLLMRCAKLVIWGIVLGRARLYRHL
jgi:aspartyl/asparaginyl beta-hydroxylase (cupin superfamily)